MTIMPAIIIIMIVNVRKTRNMTSGNQSESIADLSPAVNHGSDSSYVDIFLLFYSVIFISFSCDIASTIQLFKKYGLV